MPPLPLHSELFTSHPGNNLLVILHGLYGSSRNWRSIGRSISVSNPLYSVVLLDLRNHGKSPHSSFHSIEEMSSDVISFIRSQSSFTNIILAGHSMGGRVAMKVATDTTENILNGLILLDISPLSHGLDHIKEKDFHVSFIHNLRNMPLFNNISNVRMYLQEKKYKSDFIEWVLTTNFKLNPSTLKPELSLNLDPLEDFVNSQLYSKNSTGIIEKMYPHPFNNPTLLIKGSESKYVTKEDFTDINKLFPKNKTIEIPGVGHWVHSEAPVLVISAISTFLSTIELVK